MRHFGCTAEESVRHIGSAAEVFGHFGSIPLLPTAQTHLTWLWGSMGREMQIAKVPKWRDEDEMKVDNARMAVFDKLFLKSIAKLIYITQPK